MRNIDQDMMRRNICAIVFPIRNNKYPFKLVQFCIILDMLLSVERTILKSSYAMLYYYILFLVLKVF